MDIFKRKILAKLIIILVATVSVISIISILYFDKKNTDTLRSELIETINNLREVASLAYAIPLWQMGETEIAYLNRAILTNKNIVAVNIYDDSGKFLEGLQKDLKTMKLAGHASRTSFITPQNRTDIKKLSYAISHRGFNVGSFEIFYTERYVNQEIARRRANLALVFTLTGLSMIIVIFIVVKKMLIAPVLTLADISRQITSNKDYSVKVEKRSEDEIGILYDSIAGMLREIERNEDELRRTRAYLSNIIESMPSILVSIDREGSVTQWNRAAETATGIPSDRILGKNLWQLTDFFDNFKDYLPDIMMTGKPVHLHGYRFEKAGTSYKDISLYPLVSDGIIGVVIRMDDVTELERKENLLRQAQKMESIGTLASGIAHDFNNILGGIIGNVSLIQYKMRSGIDIPVPELSEIVTTIDRSSNRAADLVKQLLTLSSKKEMSFLPVDLNLVVKNVIHISGNTFDKVVALREQYAEGKALVLGDNVQIEQIVLNLCINAYHALTIMKDNPVEGGGTISVSVQKIEPDNFFLSQHPEANSCPYWCLSVEDNGVGIPESMFPKIFDPFFTTKGTGRGTGLGLAVAYNIIRQHSGFIDVTSTVNAGTTFSCYIPCFNEAGIEEKPAVREELPRGTGCVLVVDDEAVMREVASAILDELGYTTIVAEGGDEALKIFSERRHEIDMVLLDVIMPKRSGRQVYADLKQVDPGVKVLFASGYWQENSETDITVTFDDAHFIQKPYTLQAIAEAIKKRLE